MVCIYLEKEHCLVHAKSVMSICVYASEINAHMVCIHLKKRKGQAKGALQARPLGRSGGTRPTARSAHVREQVMIPLPDLPKGHLKRSIFRHQNGLDRR